MLFPLLQAKSLAVESYSTCFKLSQWQIKIMHLVKVEPVAIQGYSTCCQAESIVIKIYSVFFQATILWWFLDYLTGFIQSNWQLKVIHVFQAEPMAIPLVSSQANGNLKLFHLFHTDPMESQVYFACFQPSQRQFKVIPLPSSQANLINYEGKSISNQPNLFPVKIHLFFFDVIAL